MHDSRLTPLALTHENGPNGGHGMMHSNRSDTMESSASSNSPLDSTVSGGGIGTSSPVSSAVRSLTSLSDFSSLDMTTGGGAANPFDAYGGVQPITDSLLSGVAPGDGAGAGDSKGSGEGNPSKTEAIRNNNNNYSGAPGPLLDFKSAFSVLDDKSGNIK